MSFKEFSATHGTPGKDKPQGKPKDAPAIDRLPGQPEKTPASAAPEPQA